MKKLLISIFVVAAVALTGVVTVVPEVNNYKAQAVSTCSTYQWYADHEAILAKTVDEVVLADGAEIVAALEGYDQMPANLQADCSDEYQRLVKLHTRYEILQWIDDHSAVFAKTEADVVEADWPNISAAFDDYNDNLFDKYSFENVDYANNKMDHLVKLTKKIASPEAVALADKYDYLVTMPLDKVTVDQVVDYYYIQEEAQDLTDIQKFSLMVYRAFPRIEKANELKDAKFNDTIPPTDAEGDAKSEFLMALAPNIPGAGNLTVNKVAPKDSQADKLKGVKLKDVVWSRDIEQLNSSGNVIPQLSGPMRIYLKVTDQKVIDLIKSNKIEMAHVHKKTDGTYEAVKTPFVFNERYNVIAFTTDKFSKFSLFRKGVYGPMLANTGNSHVLVALVAVLAVVVSSAGLAVAANRR